MVQRWALLLGVTVGCVPFLAGLSVVASANVAVNCYHSVYFHKRNDIIITII